MTKKILIGLGALIVVLVAVYFYMDYRNYSMSPKGEAKLTNGNLEVAITYCRPSVRDRLIFGEESDGALQPYGEYWRLGANESTEITFNQDVMLVDQEVKKGTYKMYAVPGEHYFEIWLNSELGTWGYADPNKEKDVTSVMLAVTPNEPTEQFTIELQPMYDNSIKAVFMWDKIKFELPIIAN